MVLMLLEQIVQLFLCIVLGWLLVRLHLLKPEDSRVLSKVCLYLVTPCVIINAFQLQRTPELLQGLALSLGAAIGIHAWGRSGSSIAACFSWCSSFPCGVTAGLF